MRMKTWGAACLLVASLLVPAMADAGAIYGTILFNGAGLKGAAITIACGGDTVKGATLDDGSYRITTPEGRCTFTVAGSFGTASAEVTSASSATRYVFDVVKGGSGYELRRQ
jgi:hypothetical protein